MDNDIKVLVNKIGEILCEKDIYISTAESCTGGMVAAELIAYPGISKVFLEGAITYSNEAKVKRLNLDEEILKKFGAVSKETATAMAIGIANTSGSRASVVTTGIAGPGGGSKEKPVGLVYVGVFLNGRTIVNKFLFKGDRESIRMQSTKSALEMLLVALEKE